MERRQQQLVDIQNFTGKVDAELTMILQQLQWDRSNLLLEKSIMVNCKYDFNHRIPIDRRDAHESQCFFITNGYAKEDKLLPDPMDTNSSTLIKLGKSDIKSIIDIAAQGDPSFKRDILNDFLNQGIGSNGAEPMSLERLQSTYTADERRAIHDAVVKAAPSCHDLSDLALLSGNEDEQNNAKQKSRLEILAELRDMKRRRTKYRVAAKTRNYSDLLRDVIKTQMEVYIEVKENQQEPSIAVSMQNKTDYPRVVTNNEMSGYRHQSELNRSRDRSRDQRSREHSRHDLDDNSKRKERYDHYHDVPSTSKVNKSYEDNHKKRKRHKSSDRSDGDYVGERNFRYKNTSKADFEINNEVRVKKERGDDSIDDSERYDRYSRQKRDETDYRYSNTGNHRRDKTKYNPESSSYSGSSNQVHIKQEDDRYYERGSKSQSNSYDESKYSKERSKVRHEDRSHDRRKDDRSREKYEKEHYTHRTASKEDVKREESRYQRYYD